LIGGEKTTLPVLDYQKLQSLVDALQPIAECTKQLSSRDSTIAAILPTYELLAGWLNPMKLKTNTTERVRRIVAEGLQTRMVGLESSP
jgi:hypothetical protein